MDEQICYYKNDIADKTLDSVSRSVIFKKSKNFPRILLWNRSTQEIPSTHNCSVDFKKYYHSKVVDQMFLNSLEDEHVINTDPNLAKFYPIITPADGNCLCHAVSLYLWGIPDRKHFLRQMLYITMVTDENKLLQRLYMQHVANLQSTEENFSTSIWSKQWEILVKEAQEIPINTGSTHLEPLEAIHIFILANILLRPIVVLSSPVVRTVFNHTIQANDIAGIYLPLLYNTDDTEKSPIVLGYHMSHFVPMLHVENSSQKKAVPLKRIELVNLPVHFFQDPLPDRIARKLNTYLKIDKETESAMVGQTYLPKDQNMFYVHFEHCKALFDNIASAVAGNTALPEDMAPSVAGNAALAEYNPQTTKDDLHRRFVENHSETIHIVSSSLNKSPSFCINNCGMYGSAELGNKCSQCFSRGTSISATTRPQNAGHKKQSKATYEDVLGQKNSEQSRQLSIKQVALATGYRVPSQACEHLFQSRPQESHEKSVQDHKQERFHLSLKDFQPAGFLNKRKLQIETALYRPTPQHVGEQFEETNLETATCVTPGCQVKAYRKMQYRCESCFRQMNSQGTGKSLSRPVSKRQSPTIFDSHGQVSDYSIRMQLNQIPDTAGANLVHRNESQTQVSTEDRLVSLLELLCSKDDCPNRRTSPLDSMCESCSRKNGTFYCSVPGCSNEQEQNLSYMCKGCFRNNELKKKKIQANRNMTNHMPHPEIYETKQGKRICDKPNCINSRGTHSSGYCLQCFMAMEKTEPLQPSAPSFHKERVYEEEESLIN